MSSSPPSTPAWQRFAAGTASGAALVLVGHPLDTLKVKMQTSSGGARLRDVVLSLARTEGLRGFYRGMSAPLALTGFINTVMWGIQFNLVDYMTRNNFGGTGTQKAMLAAVPTGLLVSLIVTPVEGIKSRMQVRGGREGAYSILKSVLEKDGIRGLYRGLTGVALARASNWAYFGGFAAAEAALRQGRTVEGGWQKTAITLGAGGCAGICYWLAAYPFDIVKARMMAAPDGLRPPLYSSTLDCARKLYQEAGPRGFFRGFTPTLIRAFPANAAAFFGFDFATRIMNRWN